MVICCALVFGAQFEEPEEKLVFQDDFDKFDLKVWKHEITAGGGGNWEFEYYTNNRSNSYVKDSILYIKPTLTSDRFSGEDLLTAELNIWGSDPANLCTGNAFYGCERAGGGGGNIINPIQSASVRTVGTFEFQYGRLEIRAKLPRGDWLWPAIWLLPADNSYGDWPASGEIDIVESRGNGADYPGGGVNQFGSTLHWGPFYPIDPYQKTHAAYTLPQGDFSEDFHIFGLVWNNNTIYTYLDDPSQKILDVTIDQTFWEKGGWTNSGLDNPWNAGNHDAPFDQPFYVIFNVAVGGTNGYFPDGMAAKPWSDKSPHAPNDFWNNKGQWLPTWKGENAALQVDWIKIYQ